MTFHENEVCLVCNEAFKAEDDIVVCPVCGTPHHRECYNKLGHCVNASKHKEGYEYTASASSPTIDQESEPVAADSDKLNVCPNCGKELDKTYGFCTSCGAYQEDSDFSATSVGELIEKRFEGEDVEGKKVTDIVKVVGSNSGRFLKRFRKGKKVSWNWGAFFFGPFYLVYRKMYKEGIIVFALNAIASLYINAAFSDQLIARQKVFETFASTVGSGKAVSDELMQKVLQANEQCLTADILVSAVAIGLCVCLGLLADWFYKKKVFSVIDNIDASLSADSDDNNAKPIFIQASSDTPKSKLRDLYLVKSGGTNLIFPVIMVILGIIL